MRCRCATCRRHSACIEDANSASQLLRGAVLLGIGMGALSGDMLAEPWAVCRAGHGRGGSCRRQARCCCWRWRPGSFIGRISPYCTVTCLQRRRTAATPRTACCFRQRDDKALYRPDAYPHENSLFIFNLRDGVLDGRMWSIQMVRSRRPAAGRTPAEWLVYLCIPKRGAGGSCLV